MVSEQWSVVSSGETGLQNQVGRDDDGITTGIILINTGPGKGKTTAALGTAMRAVGNGMRVLMLQFLKGSWHYGELDAVEGFGGILF